MIQMIGKGSHVAVKTWNFQNVISKMEGFERLQEFVATALRCFPAPFSHAESSENRHIHTNFVFFGHKFQTKWHEMSDHYLQIYRNSSEWKWEIFPNQNLMNFWEIITKLFPFLTHSHCICWSFRNIGHWCLRTESIHM